MRIEVLVDNGEPEIYPLNKNEILLGAGDQCDVIINAHGISRKHLKIMTTEDDQYFVIDQGSTNGSFINEERLVPGRRVEFTSFFPVRLGDNVLLTLLSDEESQDFTLREFARKESTNPSIKKTEPFPESSSTRVINLNDLKKAKTTELVKKRQATVAKKKGPPKKEKKKKSEMFLPSVICGLILAAAVYYHMNKEADEEIQVVQEIPQEIPKEIPKEAPNLKIEDLDRISKEKISVLFRDLKCLNPDEKYFCESIPSMNEKMNGVIQSGSAFVFMIEETFWLSKAREMLPHEKEAKHQSQEVQESFKDETYKVGFMEFLLRQLMTLDPSKLKEKVFYLAFYDPSSEKPEVTKVMAIKSEAFSKIKSRLSTGALRSMKRNGYRIISDIDAYFNYY